MIEKPPLGIMPEYIWREERMWEIIRALNRYADEGYSPPKEWLRELPDRIREVLNHERGI